MSKLHDAASSGSVERTVNLLSSGSSSEIDRCCGDPDRTPLMVAAERGYLRIVRVLLRNGASVSAANDCGQTALHFAVHRRHVAVSKALIRAGADLERRFDRSKMEDACCVEHGPLHLASKKGFCELMVVLIDAGADVDSVCYCVDTPLSLAAEKGRLEAVRVLLRAKANPFVGSCALSGAASGGHLAVVRELVESLGVDGCTRDGGAEALIEAAFTTNTEVVAFLCDAGVVDTYGSALCAAVESHGEECTKLLLQRRGGNANITSTRAYVGMAHRTYEAGDDLRVDESGLVCTFELPRFYAARSARLLIDAGADTDAVVHYIINEDSVLVGTPLVVATSALQMWETEAKVRDLFVDGIKGVIRLLYQAEAVHAVSWLWPKNLPVFRFGRTTEEPRKKKSSAILTMLPLLKRGAKKSPRAVLSALSRFVCV